MKVITEADIDALAKNGVVEVMKGMIVTPLAREYASRKGIRLVYGGGSVPSAEAIPGDPGTLMKGPVGPSFGDVKDLAEEVTREVVKALMTEASEEKPKFPLQTAQERARAVVVATGVNRPGVAAAISSAISHCGADIQDISQTLVSDFYSMIFVVNLETLSPGLTFKDFKERVEAAGRDVGAEIVVVHEAVLRAMHRV